MHAHYSTILLLTIVNLSLNNQVSPVKAGPSYQLKSIDLQDESRKHKIQVNLWGDYSKYDIPASGTRVTVENVLTSQYQESTVLNATQETAILVSFD